MRKPVIAVLTAAILLVPAAAARADHATIGAAPAPALQVADQPLVKVGDIRYVANAQAAHGVSGTLGEGGTFTRDGKDYLVASSAYGLSVVDVTNPLRPSVVSTYIAAAACPQAPAELILASVLRNPGSVFGALFDAALGLVGWENDLSVSADGRFAALGMDAAGRCHDPEGGGVELIDLANLTAPRALHLVRNVGDAHSITIDPVRDGLAWVSTSDRNDFMDIIDFRSCLGGVAELDTCRPTVARAVFSQEHMPGVGEPDKDGRDSINSGCHDIWFRGDRGYCAAIGSTAILDVSHVLGPDGELTGTHITEGDNACPIDAAELTDAGVKVTDCNAWTEAAFEDLDARSADVRLVSVIDHDGSKPPTENVEISHQAMATADGKILFITDERGGGLGFGPNDGCPGGGVWFYDIRDDRNPVLMRQPDGKPGVFITQNFVQTYASCTTHYGEQLGDEYLMAFAWYTAGTHVFRFTPDFSKSPPEIEFEEVAAYLPAGAWTIASKPLMRNPDDPEEVIVYSGDANRGLDIFAVTVEPSGPGAKAASGGGGAHAAKGRGSGAAGGGGGGGADVAGARATNAAGGLPSTGLNDPTALALALLGFAVAIAQRLRRV